MRSILTLCFTLCLQLVWAQTNEMGIRTTVFIDDNGNGSKDATELLLGNVGYVVEMQILDENMNVISTEVTDEYGSARFVGLAEGNYYLQFQPPSKYNFSSPVTNINDDDIIDDDNGIQEDSDDDGVTDGPIRSPLIKLEVGTEATNESSLFVDEDFGSMDENNNWTVDFGVMECKGFDGTIFLDSNNNGCKEFEESESGANLLLYLCDSGGTDGIGLGNVISSSSSLTSLGRNVCLTSYHDYYLELETNRAANFNSSDSCSIVTYNEVNSTVGQSNCFNIGDLSSQLIELGYNDLTSSSYNQEKNSFIVYPNPAEDVIIIQSEFPVSNVSLYNLSGIRVAQTKVTKEQSASRIDVSEVVSGFYLLEFKSENSMQTVKVHIAK